MQCSCGGETSQQSHQVKTAQAVAKWLNWSPLMEGPWKISQDVCLSCGRMSVTISIVKTREVLGKWG